MSIRRHHGQNLLPRDTICREIAWATTEERTGLTRFAFDTEPAYHDIWTQYLSVPREQISDNSVISRPELAVRRFLAAEKHSASSCPQKSKISGISAGRLPDGELQQRHHYDAA